MKKGKGKDNGGEGNSSSLIDVVLNANKNEALLKVPEDPSYVYPVSSFPSLSTFDIAISYPALVIPARRIPEIRKSLSGLLLQRAKLKVVYNLDEKDPIPTSNSEERGLYRKIVLADLPNIFETEPVKILLSSDCCQTTHTVTTSYEDWTVEQVLRRTLPIHEIPSAFEIIGHLAHINLRDEVLPFKYIVGKAVLDKNAPRIKTVVNKVGTIETEYRTFGMEVIAGNKSEGWSQVIVKEEGCHYHLDFTKVYWNSRLGGEHRRLVEIIRKEAAAKSSAPLVVADLMAGIGPFAVPLTSRKDANIHVYANDLNPYSYESLVVNAKKNKCENLHCYNMDGRRFCHKLQDEVINFHHVLMNLPATAPEFLDAFRGFRGKTLPRIHVHCFSSKDPKEAERDTIQRCATALGCPLDVSESNIVVHTVRNIAPNKNMYCVSFDLPEVVRSIERIQTTERAKSDDEPSSKKAKLG